MNKLHKVINFYSERDKFGKFSNFYKHEPFEFVMPNFLPKND